MIDFLGLYGKIEYKDSSGRMQVIDELSVMKKNYFGKVVYIIVPEDVSLTSSYIMHIITIRGEPPYFVCIFSRKGGLL